jgi:ribosomal protein S18 acetylase RimI-like enzyme
MEACLLEDLLQRIFGAVAQLGERCVRNAEVEGSSPFRSTLIDTRRHSLTTGVFLRPLPDWNQCRIPFRIPYMSQIPNDLIFSCERPVTVEDLLPLFAQTHWADKRDPDDVRRMLAATQIVMGVWQQDRLIGFARVLTDGLYRAIIDDVVVDGEFRKLGIGERMMRDLAAQLSEVEEIFLRCDPDMVPYYSRLGYRERIPCMELLERDAPPN